MQCTNHPQTEAAGMCMYCGKPFCAECLAEVKGKMYCKADINKVFEEASTVSMSSTAAPPAAVPVINIHNDNSNVNENINSMGYGFPPGYAPRSKVVALILCIIFGSAGIHRFYTGKIGTGILWLFTAGLFGIGWIIDLIIIIAGGFRDSYGYPLR